MFRVAFVALAIVVLTAILAPFQLLAIRYRWPLRRQIPIVYHRIMCRLLGVRVRVVGAPVSDRPLLILANHSSWLDITVITSVLPVVFVAKREVGTWPFFGMLAKLQRSVFVDRERRHKTAEASNEIAQRLLDGDPVVLFGEGTSSDGNRVLPFRTALIGAARDVLETEQAQQVTVQPLSVAYVGYQGLPVGRGQRYAIAWYGTVDLIPHLVNIIRRGAIDVVVTWGEPVVHDRSTNRKELARAAEVTVRRLTTDALRNGMVSGRTRTSTAAAGQG